MSEREVDVIHLRNDRGESGFATIGGYSLDKEGREALNSYLSSVVATERCYDKEAVGSVTVDTETDEIIEADIRPRLKR